MLSFIFPAFLTATSSIRLQLSPSEHITTTLSFSASSIPLLVISSIPDTFLILCNTPLGRTYPHCFSPPSPSFCRSQSSFTPSSRSFSCPSVTADIHNATPHPFSFHLDHSLISGLAVELQVRFDTQTDSVPIRGIVSFDDPAFRLPDNTAGILGIAAQVSSCRDSTFFARLVANYKSIELTPPTATQDGSIHFTDRLVAKEWVTKVTGSIDAALISSTVTGVEMCGTNLIEQISAYYKVVIDTGKKCLGLPKQLFHRYQSWRPQKAEITLVFGKTIELARIILSNDLCVEQNAQVPLKDWGRMVIDPIYLGTEVLSKVGKVIVEVRGWEYGRVQIEPWIGIRAEMDSCSSVPVCIGDQVYFRPGNLCQDPKCSNFFFAVLDEEKKVCVYDSWVKPMFVAVVVGLGLAQIFAARLRKLAIEKATTRI
jgi:hypothetical protein